MALKNKEGHDLLLLTLKLDWQNQTGLYMTFAQGTVGATMAITHVDELIGELIKHRDTMEELNKKRKD